MATVCQRGMDTFTDPVLRKYVREHPLCTKAPEYGEYCIEHLPPAERRQYEWEQTTQEQRQKYLDLLHTGKTIGEAYQEAGISFEAALEVTNRSLDQFHFLKRTAE